MKSDNLSLSCFKAHKECNKNCITKNCKYWHNLETSNNCIINKINEEKDLTLQEIGDLFNITRMRVCQIEKLSLKKLSKLL